MRVRTLRRAVKVVSYQLLLLGQLPIVFGLVTPISLVASLGVFNVWVGIDLVVGAVLTLMLVMLCVARRVAGDAWLA